MKRKIEARYTGAASRLFWGRVAKIKTETAHDLVYMAGVALQEHENRVLQMLICAEEAEE